jgi:nitronate monooxygenase
MIIQGGMGVGISNWRLAQAVSKTGQLGVVSGTALDQVFVRRLTDGDPGGYLRRALEAFPFPDTARRLLGDYFIAGGKPPDAPYPALPMYTHRPPPRRVELSIVANFAEVWLGRQGHLNAIGVNFLEKVQLPHLASIYGAMLAGVGCILMGAGIPIHIPAVLDAFAAGGPAEYRLSVTGVIPGEGEDAMLRFDPADYFKGPLPKLTRPRFLAIVSSHVLAASLLRRSTGKVDGFVVEGPTAGGHNAPPRGKMQLNAAGEPQYGVRDQVDLAQMRALGVPFWLAGGYSSHAKLAEALAEGAAGVQVGTAFAFSEESGLREDMKRALLAEAAAGVGRILTDPLASPTGFPFKVAQLAGTASESEVYESRTRACDLGFLREAYAQADGRIGYRCSAEKVPCYVSKGGAEEDAVGRKCLCNALLANIGLAQIRPDGAVEPPLVTLGDDVNTVGRFLAPGRNSYSAEDVIGVILGSEGATPKVETAAAPVASLA